MTSASTLMRSGFLALAALAAVVATPAEAAPKGKGPTVTAVLATETPLLPGEYLWDDDKTPGELRIVVDIARQQLYVYRGGTEIGRTIIMYGADHKPTPTGQFTVLEKDIDHVSNIYNAPMPYMLRLTWTGIAIHGSGNEVDARYATHGCVGVPDEFAARLYAVTAKGARVLVTRGWMPALYGTEPAPPGGEEWADDAGTDADVAITEPAVETAQGW